MTGKRNPDMKEWKSKLTDLKTQLPKGKKGKVLDARAFRGCWKDGSPEKVLIAQALEDNGVSKDKADAIYSFLTHLESKPAAGTGKKRKVKKTAAQASETVNVMVKKLYKGLDTDQLEKLIAMLVEIRDETIDQDLAKAEAVKAKQEEKIKTLKTKKAAMAKKP